MQLLELCLMVSATLCGLVAGLVFTFAVVVMPGLNELDDHGYLEAFGAIDGIIQKGQPLFLLVWPGSVVAIVATLGLGVVHLQGLERTLSIAAGVVYLLGVQLPTFAINLPLNNRLKATDLATAPAETKAELRAQFQNRWVAANNLRTVLATVTVVLLLVTLLRL